MFQGKKQSVDREQTDTLIGKETVLEGKVESEASLRIEGKVKGNVHCEGDCTVGEQGEIEADIHAHSVIIAGKVKGNVYAKEKLHVLSSGKLEGNISAARLIMEEGALFNGQSDMKADSGSKGKEQPKPEEKKEAAG